MSIRAKTNDLVADFKEANNTIDLMLFAYEKAVKRDENLLKEMLQVKAQMNVLELKLMGSEIREEVGEKNEYPSIWTYIWGASSNGSTYGATTSQLKYNHLCIFDCILLSRPFVSIQPDVAFASLRLLKECKSIFTTVFSGCRLKNLIILFVAFSNGIFGKIP